MMLIFYTVIEYKNNYFNKKRWLTRTLLNNLKYFFFYIVQ